MSDPAKVMNECNPEGTEFGGCLTLTGIHERLAELNREVSLLWLRIRDPQADEEAKSAEHWMHRWEDEQGARLIEKDRADNQAARAEKLAKALAAAPVSPGRKAGGGLKPEDIENVERFVLPNHGLSEAVRESLLRILAGCREWTSEISWAKVAGGERALRVAAERRAESAEQEVKGLLFEFDGMKKIIKAEQQSSEDLDERLQHEKSKATDLQARVSAAEKEVERLTKELEETNNEFVKEHKHRRSLQADRDRILAAAREIDPKDKPRPCGLVELPGVPTDGEFGLVGELLEASWWREDRKKALVRVLAFAQRARETAAMVTDADLQYMATWNKDSAIGRLRDAHKKLRGSA